MTTETEIKIPLSDLGVSLDEARARIERNGFNILHARLFERNLVFDLPTSALRQSGQLLRLRDAGGDAKLTFKGVSQTDTKHKSREERETSVGDFEETRIILERLGYQVAFIYEKYRTEYAEAAQEGIVTLDETPIGDFLELEGPPDWIDATAARLGFHESDYKTASYSALYLEWCQRKGVQPGNMQFNSAAGS